MIINKSKKLDDVMQSEIRNMSVECDKVGGINLAQGICDLPLSQILVEATNAAMIKGINHYTRCDGLDELRIALANKLQKFNHIEANPEKNIVISAGTTGAFYCACYALLNPGDEVILFEPYYGYHDYTLKSVGAVPVFAKLKAPNWDISMDDLERLITRKTKAIMINTPSNPCGKVFTYDELQKMADFCIKHNLFIFTDEIYEYITYDGNKHISPGSLEKIKDRTITIGGYSKTYSITGWRIGYSVANEGISKLIAIANDLLYVCAPAPLQYGVAKAIENLPLEFYNNLKKDYTYKRNMLCETLDGVGLHPFIPQGAYYVLADVSKIPGANSKEKSMWLLKNVGIGSVPGEAFYKGNNGNNYIRFCFAKDLTAIKEVCKRLRDNKSKWGM
jgi:aminotransferase